MNRTDASTVVLVDSCIEDAQLLASGVVEEAEIFLLDSSQNSISQISEILAKFDSIESLHIVSHGQPGHLQLGTTALTSETLPAYGDRIRQWRQSFAKGGSILLYGCQVAANTAGRKFVQTLHELTQISIAASTTLTGCAARDGDWDLDVQIGGAQIGEVHASSAFHPSVLAAYAHVLPTANLLYGSGTGTSSNVLKIVDTADGSFQDVATLSFQTFALARDAATGRIYYIENKNNGKVAYYDPATGDDVTLGTTGVGVTFYKLAQSVSGQLYGMDNTTSNLYTIDKTTGAAASLGAITIGGSNLKVGSGDIAFDPNDPNRLFVSAPDGSLTLYTVDTNPSSAGFLKATKIQATGLSITSFGALAFGADGQLYTVSNGELYRLDPTGGTAPAKIGTAAGNYSDFASLPVVTPTADLQVTVSDGLTSVAPNSSITYTVTVTNASTTDLTNISVSDLVPSDVTGVTWTAAVTGSGGFPTTADESGSGNPTDVRVNLNAGAKVVYTIQGTVSNTATAGSTLTNQASVSADGINDPDLSNNSATDQTIVSTPASPTITVDSLVTADRTPQLTGTVSSSTALIKVTVNGQTYDATNNGNGTWTLANDSITTALADNIYSVTAVATAVDGVTVLATDTTANELTVDGPPAVTVTSLTTGDFTPKLTGTVDDPNATVKVTVNGQTYDAINNKDGTWTLPDNSITPALKEGNYEVAAVATDTASNSGNDTSNLELTIDAAVTVDFLTTDDHTSKLTGTVDQPDLVVRVIVNGATYNAVNNGDGTWALPNNALAYLPDGTYDVQVAAAPDGSENFVYDATTNELVIESIPVVTVNSLKTGDSTPQLTGTVDDPEAIVTVTINGKAYTAVNNKNGTWTLPDDTIAPGLADGIYSVLATAKDISSNTGTDTTSNELTIDSTLPQVIVTPIDTITGEDGSTGTFQVVLNRQPTAEVTLSFTTSDTTEGTLTTTQVTFTPTNWNSPQLVTVSGVDDTAIDGSIAYSIKTSVSSSDSRYNGLAVAEVGMTNLDNELPNPDQPPNQSPNQPPPNQPPTTNPPPQPPEDCGCQCESGLTLDGTPRKNNLRGTPSTDRLNGRKGGDVLHGLACDDMIRGGSGKDRLFGDNGNDFLKGELGNDRLRGGKGTDHLRGGRGRDRLSGGEGEDLLRGQRQRDWLWGGKGKDRLFGGLGHDVLRGNADDDYLAGNRGRDRLKGGSGKDVLEGGIDRDRLNGGFGDDILRGGRGRDLLWGRGGNDILLGGQERDVLWGYSGNDVLVGGLRQDKLEGGAGNDVLIGGRRADRLTGGAGRDQFIYRRSGDWGDHITDFGATDIIDVSRLLASLNQEPASWKKLIDLDQVGSNTVVRVNLKQEPGDRFQPFSITLESVNMTTLGQQNFVVG